MLGECLEVFRERLQEEGEELILDKYVLKDGTYLLVGRDGSIVSKVDIQINKKLGK